MIIPATWDELARKYHELVAAVWGCPIDELDAPDITHESTVAEVDRQIKAEVKASIEVERLRAENQQLRERHEVLKLRDLPRWKPTITPEALK